MTTDLLQTLHVLEGTVSGFTDTGHVAVDVDGRGAVPCRLLETSGGPPLALAIGDRVLVAALPGAVSDGSPDGLAGGPARAAFVLGRVALHVPAPAATPSGRTVEIVMPEGVETVRVTATRVRIAADEEIVLECGGASLRLDRRGRVVVLGTDITSRARRLHKIKGASVAIN